MENSEQIIGLYYHAIAEKLSENYISNKKFRRPMDAEAYRIANEYAIEYLGNHSMDITEELAKEESNQYILERHTPTWLARKLKLVPNEPLFPQLIQALGKDQPATVSNTYSDTEDQQQEIRSRGINENALPKIPDAVKGKQIGRRNLMSDDEDMFTGVMNTTYVEENNNPDVPEKKHHHNSVFTALDEQEQITKKPNRLYQGKQKNTKKLAPPPRDFRAHLNTDTVIDTQ